MILNGTLPVVQSVEFRFVQGARRYCVGSDGSLWSRRKRNGHATDLWRKMSPGISSDGYRVAFMKKSDGTRFVIRMSRLMLITFIGHPAEGMQACHCDGIRTNDDISNLRWDDQSGNQRDRNAHGTDIRGEKHFRAKLTALDVIAIRKRLKCGERIVDFFREYNVAYETVCSIAQGRSWRHLL